MVAYDVPSPQQQRWTYSLPALLSFLGCLSLALNFLMSRRLLWGTNTDIATVRQRPLPMDRPSLTGTSSTTRRRPSLLPAHYNASGGFIRPDDEPYIATVQVDRVFERRAKDADDGRTFYDFLVEKEDCLHANYSLQLYRCHRCLGAKPTLNCSRCIDVCGCFCDTICNESPPALFVSKQIRVNPPHDRKDRSRIIPRIVHQTYFERVTADKYPRLHRLSRSFRESGWEYRFYDDKDAEAFLGTHFPFEFLETFKAILPGAFKADFLRCCLLLIYGGVYADIDVHLEGDLDVVIPNDAGFVAPFIDTKRAGPFLKDLPHMYNGFFAAAPGHPILVQHLERTINNVRNRFTTVDIEESYCDSDKKFLLAYESTPMYFISYNMGPTVNEFLGRDKLAPFDEYGTLDSSIDRLVGRTVALLTSIPTFIPILESVAPWQIFLGEKNSIAVSVDDLQERDGAHAKRKHYYSLLEDTRDSKVIFGLRNIYIDQVKAKERVRIVSRYESRQDRCCPGSRVG